MNRMAVLFVATALFAAPAVAGTYSAKPISVPASAKIIGKDISWTVSAGAYVGSTESSRPLVICQDLAKHAGRLESFTANGQPLAGADLDKCNAKAGGAGTELAHAN